VHKVSVEQYWQEAALISRLASVQQQEARMRRRLSIMLAFTPIFVFGAFPAFASELFVYRGGGCTGRDRLPAFIAMAGREPDGVVAFTERTSWQNMLNSVTWSAN